MNGFSYGQNLASFPYMFEISSCPSPSVDVGAGSRSLQAWEDARALWPNLKHLGQVYPGFSVWYWGKVIPGVLRGSRRIFIEGRLQNPEGVAIAKREADECKVCTLWVSTESRGKGVGRRLLGEAIDWVGVKRPVFTVPQERHDELRPLLRRFNFEKRAALPSLYRPGVLEHIYNGEHLPSFNS